VPAVWFDDGRNGSQLLTPDQRIELNAAGASVSDVPFADGSGAVPPEAVARYSATLGPDSIAGLVSAAADAPRAHGHQLRSGAAATTDAWSERILHAPPSGRERHTAIWTGSEMIVWGGEGWNPDGSSRFGDGGCYHPPTNTWTGISTTGAPSTREGYTTVWTGIEMIVWGGSFGSFLGDGSRYNPAGSNWTPVTLVGAPAARNLHTAVWTGIEMIVCTAGFSRSPHAARRAPNGLDRKRNDRLGRRPQTTDLWVMEHATTRQPIGGHR
jgi:hypothetical protein